MKTRDATHAEAWVPREEERRKILYVVLSSFFLSSFFPRVLFAQERAPEIAGDFVCNASRHERLDLKALKGKVVLVFFWTAPDIACEDAVAELNAMHTRYASVGLEIIGVYAPEWGTRASQSGLVRTIERLAVRFPVIVDDDDSLKSDYGLAAWPSYGLVDRRGYLRHRQSGVWNYRSLRLMLETLLEERG